MRTTVYKANERRSPILCLQIIVLFQPKFTVSAMILTKANVPFLDGDFPHRASYDVYRNTSQLIWFARVCNVTYEINV